MRAIVLVKQVPDLRSAPVGVREDGTIDRARAAAITNPADLHALEAALSVSDEVWALTMGPPKSEEALREAIALGATRGILLGDRLLAGSDTWATANALAAAVAELGPVDLVAAGISALDGETGQVGPEVAVRLGWPQATGCEKLEVEADHLTVRRIVEGGYERLRLPFPAVVTVAETGYAPRYPTVVGRRRAARATVEHLTAADVGLGAERVGLAASPTKVASMEPAPLPTARCRFVGEDLSVDQLVVELRARLEADVRPTPTGEPPSTGPATEHASEAKPSTATAPTCWVYCETQDGEPARSSLELLAKAREIAPGLGGGVAAIVAGDAVDRSAAELTEWGADVVLAAEHPSLAPYRAEPHARVVSELVVRDRPSALLFAATTTGRDLAPRVAAMLDTGLAADCTDLRVGPFTRRGVTHEALLHQIRPAMSGGVLATCVCPDARPQMATVRPGLFAPARFSPSGRVERVDVDLEATDERVLVLDRAITSADVSLADADAIIAGGAGCDATSWHLVTELADVIGGRVAASRGAVEAGLAPRTAQVGQTGATVRPRLYVACGISGALQHVVGMRGARTIVAINRDPEAMIFRLADFGIVADVGEALPALTAGFARLATESASGTRTTDGRDE